jgi:hypothetical protein
LLVKRPARQCTSEARQRRTQPLTDCARHSKSEASCVVRVYQRVGSALVTVTCLMYERPARQQQRADDGLHKYVIARVHHAIVVCRSWPDRRDSRTRTNARGRRVTDYPALSTSHRYRSRRERFKDVTHSSLADSSNNQPFNAARPSMIRFERAQPVRGSREKRFVAGAKHRGHSSAPPCYKT